MSGQHDQVITSSKDEGSDGSRSANADGVDRWLDVVHGVKEGDAAGYLAALAVDVQVQVLAAVL